MEDRDTRAYFDAHTPHFNPSRFEFALSFIRRNCTDQSTLIDVGCGDGATLGLIQAQTSVSDLTGMDVSDNYLRKAKDALGCRTITGSILDTRLVAEHAGIYDFCVLGAVLHHLIGASRTESRDAASLCLRNAMMLLKTDGHLIVFEPTHGPVFLMTAIFYIKKLFGSLSQQRLELGRRWANFGQPVVSYYTEDELTRMTGSLGNADLVKRTVVDKRRFALIIQRVGLGLILQKKERGPNLRTSC